MDVALEMLHIDWIEANDGCEKSNVRFGNVCTKIVWISVFGEVSFSTIEGGEKRFYGFLIGFLGSSDRKPVAKRLVPKGLGSRVRSKARFVDAVVDVVIGPVIRPFNLSSQFLREEINGFIMIGDDIIKLRVEHADDFAGLNAEMMNSSIPFLFRKIEDAPRC